MLFHDEAALLLPAETEVCVDVEESRRWSFEVVVDDEDEGGGHASVKRRFYKANTACAVRVRVESNAESKCDDGVV